MKRTELSSFDNLTELEISRTAGLGDNPEPLDSCFCACQCQFCEPSGELASLGERLFNGGNSLKLKPSTP